jgi:Phenylpropionate dioxygenase and related ring-hydroxylating dioxygenases, large terminal subunit
MNTLTVETLASLEADLEQGIGFPAEFYTDPAITELEYAHIFHRSWQYFCRTAQLANHGDTVTGVVGRTPVVVVRQGDAINAFVNVCRHRRHLVAEGCGNRKILLCHYHGWSYGLDGSLKAAPRADGDEGFCKADFGLIPARAETWGPWVFVHLDPAAAPLAETLGRLPDIVASSGIDLEALEFHGRTEWEAKANWKVMLENYLECYHCAIAHPGFSQMIDVDPDAYVLEPHEWFSSQIAHVKASALSGEGKKPKYAAAGAITQAQYHWLFPNFTININPGFPNLSLDVWLPLGPNRAHGFSEQYFGAGVDEAWAKELMAFNEEVGAEDDELTDAVQQGLIGGQPARGRYIRHAEQLPIHFNRHILRALRGAV